MPRILLTGFVCLMLVFLGQTWRIDPEPFREGHAWQKGFAFFEESPSIGSPEVVESLRQLKETGAQTIVPVITWYVPNPQSSSIVSGSLTPSDDDLAFVIDQAVQQGLEVVLVVHVDSLDGTWRGFIDPVDKQAWFDEYGRIIEHYAGFAQEHGVGGMVIGSELVQLTQPQFTDQWLNLIHEVRQRFSGFLTYSAQWGYGGPELQSESLQEYTRVGFWSELDYLGISAYFDLSPSADVRPSVEDLRSTWELWRQAEIDPFQAAYGKPLLITEVGYRSTLGAAARPWDHDHTGAVDIELQADLYEALFQVWHDVPWLHGIYFWYWSTNPQAGGSGDAGYSPQNKPAADVVRNWFLHLIEK